MISFEDYKRDRGWMYNAEGAVEAAYERRVRLSQGGELTEEEFVIEAQTLNSYDPETLKAVYARLEELVKEGKLKPNDVLAYATYKWCLRDASALVAYERARGVWEVNNCCEVITEDEAKIAINREWGFEASRIKIIGTPYYTATDYHFIRFDCARMTWLWKNGNLYQVYA